MARIIADQREPAVLLEALRRAGHEVEIEQLDVGDFVIGPGAVIERKTGQDLVVSILDGRFVEQAAKLAATYERVFWLIQGDPYATRSAIEPAALTGALSYLATIQKATLLRTDSEVRTVETIGTMARHLQDGLGYEVNLRPGKPKNPHALAEFIVCGLPGIGGAKAKHLLAHFGSVKAVFNASPAEIGKVKGFSSRTGEALRAAIDTPYAREPSPPT